MLVDSPEDDHAVEVVGDELVDVDEDDGDGAGMLTLSSISPTKNLFHTYKRFLLFIIKIFLLY